MLMLFTTFCYQSMLIDHVKLMEECQALLFNFHKEVFMEIF